MKMRDAGLLLLAVLDGVGCVPAKPESEWVSPAQQVLAGEHQLQKMGGSYFLVAGSAAGKSEVSVSFAWLMNDEKTYALSSLPIGKLRVQFNEATEVPTIKFRWRGCVSATEIQYVMNNCVVYGLITAREQDWPLQVNLPLN